MNHPVRMKKLIFVFVLAATTSLTGCVNYERHTSTVTPRAYPLGNKCVVSGHPIEGEGVRFVTNNQEVRLCCKDCRAEFNKNPAKFLAQLR